MRHKQSCQPHGMIDMGCVANVFVRAAATLFECAACADGKKQVLNKNQERYMYTHKIHTKNINMADEPQDK